MGIRFESCYWLSARLKFIDASGSVIPVNCIKFIVWDGDYCVSLADRYIKGSIVPNYLPVLIMLAVSNNTDIHSISVHPVPDRGTGDGQYLCT